MATNPPQPSSLLSDPARAWGTNNPFSPLSVQGDEVSQAGSAVSVNSVARQAAAEQSYCRQQQIRQEAYEREEARLRAQMKTDLRLEDAHSEAVKQEELDVEPEVGVHPYESALAAELGVVERELADLEARRASLQRIRDAKLAQGVNVPEVKVVEDVIVVEDQPLASSSVKVKASPPSAWKGVYDYAQREAWIKTVEGYFAAIGLGLQARIDEVLSPYPFHIVRSLFSSEPTNGGVSVLAWFDARHRRSPFTSAKQVLDAVRSHWHDDQAADAALLAYRSARQGSARARDFGSRLETLADACFDRVLDEEDRIPTFVVGLNSQYREFVKTQVAMLKTLGQEPSTLAGYVRLAATADGLESFTSSFKNTGGVSSPTPSSTKKSSVTHTSGPSAGLQGPASGPEGKTARWRTRAEEWQTAHPASSSAEWRREGDRKPPHPQYCYHCGQFAEHYSVSCPNSRRDPKSVVLAAFRAYSSGNGPSAAPAPSSSTSEAEPQQEPVPLEGIGSQHSQQPASLAGAVGVVGSWKPGGSSPHLGPGDSVDRGEVFSPSRPGDAVQGKVVRANPGPGDAVTPGMAVAPRPGDSVDAGFNFALSSPGDSVDLGERPGRDEVEATNTEGHDGGSILAIARIGRLPEGERAEEREYTGSPDYSLPISPREMPDTSLRHSTENGDPVKEASEGKRKGDGSFALPAFPQPSTPTDADSTSGERQRKRRNRRKKTPIREPEVADQPLTVEVMLDGVKGIALTDSGSQADVLSSEFALKNGLELRRLVAPVHADLGADGHSVRLAIFTAAPCVVGPVCYESRSFFVAPLPPGIDVILGVPWMRDSNFGVSASTLSFVPEGLSEDFYDFQTGRFALQPQRNLDDLGFVRRPMTSDKLTRFFFCALAAGVQGLEDYVDYEPHNPLLDEWQDDPSQPDLSREEAEERLAKLRSDFSDVFVDDLPDCLPPFRPIKHDIHEVVDGLKIPPRVIGMPNRYRKQWTANLLEFVETGYWSPKALDS
ncbi:hypothetical protein JCM11641_006444, partial [Rhodosporidiobolus odoratus]